MSRAPLVAGPTFLFRPKNPYRVGRVQRAAQRELIAADGEPVTTTEIMRRAYPRLTTFPDWLNSQARLSATRFAISVGRSTSGSGRPRLWKLKPPTS